MKKIKLLMLAFCSFMCMAIAACELPLVPEGSVLESSSSTMTESEYQSAENSSSDSSEDSVDSNDSSSDSSEDSVDSNDPSSDSSEDPGDDVIVPEGKMLATVYYYTIQTDEGPLTYSGLVDKNATLNDFFTVHMDGVITVFNEYCGYIDKSEYQYTEEFFRDAFWQIGNKLLQGNSAFSNYVTANAKTVNLNCTPSGWGLMTGICVCEDPLNPDYMELSVPFPFEVCIADFVNWMYARDMFEMTYEEAITKGYFTLAGYTEHLTSEYTTSDQLLCYIYNSEDDDSGEVVPTEFTVYMPAVYGYYYSEMNEVGGMDVKDSQSTVYTSSTTVGEVFTNSYGDDPEHVFNYYMDGAQVSADTVLTKDCAVVCVLQQQDVELDPFTVTVYIEGQEKISYTYTRPIALRDAIAKYCAEKRVKMNDYTWTELESVLMSFDINTAWAYNVELYGYIYVEPEKPTTQTVKVLKYDGETETNEEYTIGMDVRMSAFIREYLLPNYDEENVYNNEYLFFYFGDNSAIYAGDLLSGGTTELLMIKASVLEAGYTVQIDFMNRGESTAQTYENTLYFPLTLRTILCETTSWDIDYMTFHITVNGEEFTYSEEEKVESYEVFERYPCYKDMSIVVRPIYRVNVDVRATDETDKTQSVEICGGISLPIIAQKVGLRYDFSVYGWKIGYSEEYYWDPSGFFMPSEVEFQVVVEARKVYTDFYFITAEGTEMTFETSMYNDGYAWDWSVNVQTAFETIVGTGGGMDSFDDFTWIAKCETGEFTVTAQDVLSYIIPEEYDYWDTASNYKTVYSLRGERKNVTVRVIEQNADGEVVKGEQVYNTDVTIGDILSAYGYSESNSGWFMVETLCGGYSNNFPSDWQWDTVVTWPIRIMVYIY